MKKPVLKTILLSSLIAAIWYALFLLIKRTGMELIDGSSISEALIFFGFCFLCMVLPTVIGLMIEDMAHTFLFHLLFGVLIALSLIFCSMANYFFHMGNFVFLTIGKSLDKSENPVIGIQGVILTMALLYLGFLNGKSLKKIINMRTKHST